MFLHESLLTMRALEWSLARMKPLMLPQVILAFESFVTVGTRMRARSCVRGVGLPEHRLVVVFVVERSCRGWRIVAPHRSRLQQTGGRGLGAIITNFARSLILNDELVLPHLTSSFYIYQIYLVKFILFLPQLQQNSCPLHSVNWSENYTGYIGEIFVSLDHIVWNDSTGPEWNDHKDVLIFFFNFRTVLFLSEPHIYLSHILYKKE